MAKAEQVKALIQSHAEGDEDRFYSVALQMAATAARQGHNKFAKELRELVDQGKERGSASRLKPVPLAQPRGELAGLMSVSYPKLRRVDMALSEVTAAKIDRVLKEQRQRAQLYEAGFEPQRRLLLVGPPGTGKTMTSAVLAGELGVPLFTIQLHSLITRYLGETAAKLRLIFNALASARGVYFFDEFDALGAERASPNEVGEIRRVLNSFLMFLEQDESDSLIVAATNHPALLDRALFRRFDSQIQYELPAPSIALEVIQRRVALLNTKEINWGSVSEAAEGLSHSEIVRACEQAAKDAILNNTRELATDHLVSTLVERRSGVTH